MPEIVICSMCQREWPKDGAAPKPGSGVGPQEHQGNAGYWTRDVVKWEVNGAFPASPLEFGEWYWIGPCCDHFWSGYDVMAGEDEYEEEDSEDWDEDEWQEWCPDCGELYEDCECEVTET